MTALGVLAAGLAACALSLALLGPPLVVRLPTLAEVRRRLRAPARLREGSSSIVPVLEALSGAARAGLVLRDALVIARDRARGELAARLDDALAREALGASLPDALGQVREGAGDRVDRALADAQLCAAARLPSERVAAFLEDVLSSLRFERELASDLRARTAGQRFQVWLLAAIVPALSIYLSAMSPTLAEELASPLGRGVLIPGGALFEVAGIALSRRILARACR